MKNKKVMFSEARFVFRKPETPAVDEYEFKPFKPLRGLDLYLFGELPDKVDVSVVGNVIPYSVDDLRFRFNDEMGLRRNHAKDAASSYRRSACMSLLIKMTNEHLKVSMKLLGLNRKLLSERKPFERRLKMAEEFVKRIKEGGKISLKEKEVYIGVSAGTVAKGGVERRFKKMFDADKEFLIDYIKKREKLAKMYSAELDIERLEKRVKEYERVLKLYEKEFKKSELARRKRLKLVTDQGEMRKYRSYVFVVDKYRGKIATRFLKTIKEVLNKI